MVLSSVGRRPRTTYTVLQAKVGRDASMPALRDKDS
jgi:hypothetical protein